MTDHVRTASLNKIFQEDDDQGTHIGRRLKALVHAGVRSQTPPFPRQIQIETSNICNHKCSFCAYPGMQRPSRHMDKDLFRSIAREAYELGAREIGLFAGAEPLACKWLEEYVSFCRDVGYEYLYISTNGSLATPERLRSLLDAGLSSIKFSINAGTRDTYTRIHGRDDFDKVLANVKAVSDYRAHLRRPIYLGVSMVALPETASEFPLLKQAVGPLVDEVLFYEANNESGQVEGLPPMPFDECVLPFNKLHVSLEGYIKACCNDYDNLLAIDDVKEIGLAAAWHSPRFQKLRKQHIAGQLEGTLCGKCLKGCTSRVGPINDQLLSPIVAAQFERI